MSRANKRARIFAMTAGLCWFCGINKAVTLDHIIPISKGGTNEDSNLLPACKKCNGHKMCLDVEQYRLLILNKLVKCTHVERMRLGGFYDTGLFYGERLIKEGAD